MEFASRRCGSCQEFKPEFSAVATRVPSIKFGVLYIEEAGGHALAEHYGVLDDGLPAVGLFASLDGTYTPLVKGDMVSRQDLVQMLKRHRDDTKWQRDRLSEHNAYVKHGAILQAHKEF